ncbi:MAG: sodium/glucose cotransporter 2 [Acidobacteria bacterium]|nr:MAG: sodium/glucose cotransporter 2 [Acidobacteriota bacterium]
MTLHLSVLDIAILVAYHVVVLGIGVSLVRRTRGGDDLFLAGRRLGWFPVGVSLFASNVSSTTLIGLAGAAYTWGIAVAGYEWMAAPVLVVFAAVLLPLYLGQRVTTVPEFLERRFDRRCRLYFSALTLVTNIVVDTAGSLFAGAMVIRTFFPEIGLFPAALALALFAGAYTAAGGLAAVVYTDVVQAVILLAGSCLIAILCFARFGFDWSAASAGIDPSHLSLLLPADDPNLPWPGLLVGVPLLGFYFWGTNQFIVQRTLAVRSLRDGRLACLFAGLLKLGVLFVMVLPGVMALKIVPDLPRGDMVFPALIRELLPSGLLGIVLAGLIAAIRSSVDSTLNSAATLVTVDFVQPLAPGLDDRLAGRIGRIAIGVFMVLSAALAPAIARFEGLFNYLQLALAYLVPPFVVLFTVGVLWRRGTAAGAFWSLVAGHAVSAVLFVLVELAGTLSIHFTLVPGVVWLAGAAVFVGVSLADRRGAPPGQAAVFRRSLLAEAPGVPWPLDWRVLAGGLLVLTAALVVAFR